MAEDYYSAFCRYINTYRPNIIGHFDLLTKFDEQHPLFLISDEYKKLSVRFACEAAKSGAIFEVNTGAISRGYRTAPYPHESILYALRREGAKVILCADSHAADTIDYGFEDAKALLRSVGFSAVSTLYHGEFVDVAI